MKYLFIILPYLVSAQVDSTSFIWDPIDGFIFLSDTITAGEGVKIHHTGNNVTISVDTFGGYPEYATPLTIPWSEILVSEDIMPPPPNKAYQALLGFRKKKPEPFEKQYTVCPWQSFRFQKYYTYQIDLVCDSVELAALQHDDHLFALALLHIATSYPTSIYNSELLRRWDQSPGKYKIHIPVIGPATLTPAAGALDITKNGTGGWYYESHRSGIGIAVKELKGNLFQVSAAMFLKATE